LISIAVGALTLPAAIGAGGFARAASSAAAPHLERPRTIRALLEQAGRDGRPIVAMFSIAGCPWCESIRREQLQGLAREQDARGVRVVEFDLNDETPFDHAAAPRAGAAQASRGADLARGAPSTAGAQGIRDARSAAGLARALTVRIAPTLVFLGPDGEIAERLVGYGSPDFFSAYLDDRIDRSRAALAALRAQPKR